jgi:hypothetical protein
MHWVQWADALGGCTGCNGRMHWADALGGCSKYKLKKLRKSEKSFLLTFFT